MKIIGIDPGNAGAIITMDEKGGVIEKHVMPLKQTIVNKKKVKSLDLKKLKRIIVSNMDAEHCFIEKASSFSNQGVLGMFRYGVGYGSLLAMLEAFSINYFEINSRTWTSQFHKGLPKSLDSKQKSLKIIKKLYPGINLKATERSKKAHEGLIDAILIGLYGVSNLDRLEAK